MKQKQKPKESKVPGIITIFLIINLLYSAILFALLKHLPPIIPLFYGAASSTQQVASKHAIFLPTILTLVFTLVNLIFVGISKDPFIRKVLVWSIVFLTFLSLYTTINIVRLVGSF